MNNSASFVNFSIGNACNLRCKFCYNDSSREDKQYFEDINILIDKLSSYNFKGKKSVNIIGGEPLMYPDFFQLMDYLKENKFIITIVSNGVNLNNKKFSDKFLEYKNIIQRITISIHSHNSKLEDKIVARNNTFNKKNIGIDFLVDNGFNVSLAMVVNTYNLPYLKEIIKFYKENFSINITLQGMLTYNDSSKENIEMLSRYSDLFEKINDFEGKINRIPLCVNNYKNGFSYVIRELNESNLFAIKNSGVNQLQSRLKYNYIGDKCKKCYAFGRFCFGPSKKYNEKYGYSEFNSLTKENLIFLIKESNKNQLKLNKKRYFETNI